MHPHAELTCPVIPTKLRRRAFSSSLNRALGTLDLASAIVLHELLDCRTYNYSSYYKSSLPEEIEIFSHNRLVNNTAYTYCDNMIRALPPVLLSYGYYYTIKSIESRQGVTNLIPSHHHHPTHHLPRSRPHHLWQEQLTQESFRALVNNHVQKLYD